LPLISLAEAVQLHKLASNNIEKYRIIAASSTYYFLRPIGATRNRTIVDRSCPAQPLRAVANSFCDV
jgi:hypothetical protein